MTSLTPEPRDSAHTTHLQSTKSTKSTKNTKNMKSVHVTSGETAAISQSSRMFPKNNERLIEENHRPYLLWYYKKSEERQLKKMFPSFAKARLWAQGQQLLWYICENSIVGHSPEDIKKGKGDPSQEHTDLPVVDQAWVLEPWVDGDYYTTDESVAFQADEDGYFNIKEAFMTHVTLMTYSEAGLPCSVWSKEILKYRSKYDELDDVEGFNHKKVKAKQELLPKRPSTPLSLKDFSFESVSKTFEQLCSESCPYGREYDRYHQLLQELGFTYVQKVGWKLSINTESGEAPTTAFTAHLDDVSWNVEKIELQHYTHKEQSWVINSKAAIIGADDRAGVSIMLHMIQARVPGIYMLFIGEESGMIGSRNAVKAGWANGINRMISFDRKNDNNVITFMRGERCCSEDFASALADQLNGAMKRTTDEAGQALPWESDNTGGGTDAASFLHLIPECTNLSVGYINAHGKNESQNLDHLQALTEACTKINWEALPVIRDPKVSEKLPVKYASTTQTYKYQNIQRSYGSIWGLPKVKQVNAQVMTELQDINTFSEDSVIQLLKQIEKLSPTHRLRKNIETCLQHLAEQPLSWEEGLKNTKYRLAMLQEAIQTEAADPKDCELLDSARHLGSVHNKWKDLLTLSSEERKQHEKYVSMFSWQFNRSLVNHLASHAAFDEIAENAESASTLKWESQILEAFINKHPEALSDELLDSAYLHITRRERSISIEELMAKGIRTMILTREETGKHIPEISVTLSGVQKTPWKKRLNDSTRFYFKISKTRPVPETAQEWENLLSTTKYLQMIPLILNELYRASSKADGRRGKELNLCREDIKAWLEELMSPIISKRPNWTHT